MSSSVDKPPSSLSVFDSLIAHPVGPLDGFPAGRAECSYAGGSERSSFGLGSQRDVHG